MSRRRRKIVKRLSPAELEQQAAQRGGAGEGWGSTPEHWRATWGVIAPVSGEHGGKR